jgi:hypothetical protein
MEVADAEAAATLVEVTLVGTILAALTSAEAVSMCTLAEPMCALSGPYCDWPQ